MINRLIKSFIFDEKIRNGLTFSDPSLIRLNTEDALCPRIELTRNSGSFSTAPDIYVETPLTTPHSVQKWLRFEAIVPGNQLPAGTAIGFKVKTTGDDFFWNGSAWVLAGPSDWMSEADLNANFETFPIATVGSRSIGFKVNLTTTNPNVTPQVKVIKFLGEFDIEFLEDIIYDGVVRTLNTQFRSTSLVVFPTTGSVSSIDLLSVLENKNYNVTDVRKVVNLTDDPLKLTNLRDSYSPGAPKRDGFTFEPGVINLTSAVGANKLIEVTFEFVPEIIINTSQDFFEAPAYPAIVFEDIRTVDREGFIMRDTNSFGRDVVRNLADKTGVLQFSPIQRVLRFDFAVFTGLQLNQMRLMQDLSEFFSRNKTIKSFGLDENYDLDIVEELSTKRTKDHFVAQGPKDKSDTNIATGAFELLGVLFFNKPSIDVPLIGDGQVNINLALN